MLKSLELMSREKICNVVQELFSCCHAEAMLRHVVTLVPRVPREQAMIIGNQTPEDAQKLVRELEEPPLLCSISKHL